jgi:trypsin
MATRCWLAFPTVVLLCALSSDHASAQQCQLKQRIVGGVPADIKEHPWQVALIVNGGLCGGSIIAQNWVLTAAHCFNEPGQISEARVKAGSTNYQLGGAWSAIERVVIHERYQAALNEAKKIREDTQRADAIEHIASETGFDLALVKLKLPPAGLVIPLAPPDHKLQPCDLLDVTGWGRTREQGVTSNVLLKATVPYVDTAVCNEADAYNGKIKPGMLCAGYDDGGVDSSRAIAADR